jgi:hypothetical protein
MMIFGQTGALSPTGSRNVMILRHAFGTSKHQEGGAGGHGSSPLGRRGPLAGSAAPQQSGAPSQHSAAGGLRHASTWCREHCLGTPALPGALCGNPWPPPAQRASRQVRGVPTDNQPCSASAAPWSPGGRLLCASMVVGVCGDCATHGPTFASQAPLPLLIPVLMNRPMLDKPSALPVALRCSFAVGAAVTLFLALYRWLRLKESKVRCSTALGEGEVTFSQCSHSSGMSVKRSRQLG